MKKRTLWGPLAALAALYALRIGLRMAQDMSRYNQMLAMSNEEPLLQKMPGLIGDVLCEERSTVKDWLDLFASLPGDVARYVRMGSM